MAMLKLRDGRELDVQETVETVKGLVEAGKALIEVTEVRRTVKRKFPTPVDTKAEFEHQEIKHLVAVSSIMDVQPTAEEAKLNPVHDRKQAEMPAVSGPFKHDYERHVFACEDSADEPGRRVQVPVVEADTECKKADPHGVKAEAVVSDLHRELH